jgi:uncharacterized protein (DUF433 family)
MRRWEWEKLTDLNSQSRYNGRWDYLSMSREYVEERDGGYYVAGTRASLNTIVQCFNEGLSPEAILGEFESLNLTRIFGAITVYLESQSAIDAYRVR